MTKSKISFDDDFLYFDIETSHNAALIFGGGKQYVGSSQIMKERKIFSICYMYGRDKKPTVLTMDLKKHNGHDMRVFDDDADKAMIIKFMKEAAKATILVAHNGRRFDIARIRARLVKYGLPDMPPILFDDSYTFAKNIGFTFHQLDYLGRCLEVGRKIHTDISYWTKIMVGTPAEQKKYLGKMATYNAQDVILLRSVYRKLRPYCKSQLNLAALHGDINMCPACGGKVRKDGFKLRGTRRIQQVECSSCLKKFLTSVKQGISDPRMPR